MTYFRAIRTIMGPKCLTAVFGMGTGVSTWVWSPASRIDPDAGQNQRPDLNIKKAAAECCLRMRSRALAGFVRACAPPMPCMGLWVKERINAVKRSAVSTGQLSPLLGVHLRPIDPVVFRGPSPAEGDLSTRGASRLDAFSAYPGRTLATQRCR